MCYYAICANYTIISNFCIRKNRCIGSNKNVITDSYPPNICISQNVLCAGIMAQKMCPWGNYNIIADRDGPGITRIINHFVLKIRIPPTFIPFAIAILSAEQSSIFNKCLRINIYLNMIYISSLSFKISGIPCVIID